MNRESVCAPLGPQLGFIFMLGIVKQRRPQSLRVSSRPASSQQVPLIHRLVWVQIVDLVEHSLFAIDFHTISHLIDFHGCLSPDLS